MYCQQQYPSRATRRQISITTVRTDSMQMLHSKMQAESNIQSQIYMLQPCRSKNRPSQFFSSWNRWWCYRGLHDRNLTQEEDLPKVLTECWVSNALPKEHLSRNFFLDRSFAKNKNKRLLVQVHLRCSTCIRRM